MPPGGGEEGCPDVDARIPEPVDGLGRAGGAKQEVQEAAVPVVEQLPDDPDQGQGEHHRGEEDALVDPRAADVLVQEHGQEQPQRGGDECQERQPQHVVLHGRPKRRVILGDELVVLDAGGLDVGQLQPVPAGEGQSDRHEGGDPDQYELDQRGDAHHQAEHHFVAAGQPPNPPRGGCGCFAPPRRRVGRDTHGDSLPCEIQSEMQRKEPC
ncbi:hypothetical protein SRABI128_05867 [Microbacterium sp. Bi128]|nr:hypothetical protein SRABI128_05867 [Microbacterium sp. Bi128]